MSKNHQEKFAQLHKEWIETAGQAVYEKIYLETAALVEGFLTQQYGNVQRQAIEECGQEITAKVIENLTRYDSSRAKYTTWVCTIAANHMASYMRSQARRPTTLPADAHLIPAAPSSRTLDTVAISTVQSLVAFELPTDCVQELMCLFVAAGGDPMGQDDAVKTTLARYGVQYQRLVERKTVAAFFFTLLRAGIAKDEDRDALTAVIAGLGARNPIGLFAQLVGFEAAATAILLFGGATMQLPTAAKLISTHANLLNARRHQYSSGDNAT